MNNQLGQKYQYYLNESHRLSEELKNEKEYIDLLENIIAQNISLEELEELEEGLRSTVDAKTGEHKPGLLRRLGTALGFTKSISKSNEKKQRKVHSEIDDYNKSIDDEEHAHQTATDAARIKDNSAAEDHNRAHEKWQRERDEAYRHYKPQILSRDQEGDRAYDNEMERQGYRRGHGYYNDYNDRARQSRHAEYDRQSEINAEADKWGKNNPEPVKPGKTTVEPTSGRERRVKKIGVNPRYRHEFGDRPVDMRRSQED